MFNFHLSEKEISSVLDILGDDVSVEEYDQEDDERIKQEIESIKSFHFCEESELQYLSKYIHSLQADKLANLLTHDFYNIEVLRYTTCIANSLYYQKEGVTRIDPMKRLNFTLRSIKAISRETSSQVYVANYLNSKLSFIIKENIGDVNNFAHEGIVGLAVNELRNYCPNLMYTYGYYDNVDYIELPDKEVLSAAANKLNKHLLVENISNAVPLSFFALNCNIDTFKNCFMQIVYALEIAQFKIDFTHYDLHSNNILVNKKFTTPHKYSYMRPNGKIRNVPIDYLSNIIDYGFSHVVYKNVSYGIIGFTDYNIFNKLNRYYDIFKLICNLLYTIHLRDDKVKYLKEKIKLLQDALKIFNKRGDDIHYLAFLRDNGGFVFTGDDSLDFSIFVDKLEEVWQVNYSENGYKIVDYSSLHLTSDDKPHDIYGFYDLFATDVTTQITHSYMQTKQAYMKKIAYFSKKVNDMIVPELVEKVFEDSATANTIYLYLRVINFVNSCQFIIDLINYYDSKTGTSNSLQQEITYLSKLCKDKFSPVIKNFKMQGRKLLTNSEDDYEKNWLAKNYTNID
jgi:hypothetical protein